jgi:hypothetical protein
LYYNPLLSAVKKNEFYNQTLAFMDSP